MLIFPEVEDLIETNIIGDHCPIQDFETIFDSRRHFFTVGLSKLAVTGASAAEGSLRTIFSHEGLAIPKGALLQCARMEPITLRTALCLRHGLLNFDRSQGGEAAESVAAFLAKAKFDPIRAFSEPFIVESVYFANSQELEDVREASGYTRKEAAEILWGEKYRPARHVHCFKHLEEEGTETKKTGAPSEWGYRITKFLAFRLFRMFERQFQERRPEGESLEWFDVFSSKPEIGSRKGGQTHALRRQNCNSIVPIDHCGEDMFFQRTLSDGSNDT